MGGELAPAGRAWPNILPVRKGSDWVLKTNRGNYGTSYHFILHVALPSVGSIAHGLSRLVTVVLAALVTAGAAFATPGDSGIAIRCLPSAAYFSVDSIRVTKDTDSLELPENTPELFFNSSHFEARKERIEVARRGLEVTEIVLSRTFFHIPHENGKCGAADWAEYELRWNGLKAATFNSGCDQVFLRASSVDLSLCFASYGASPWDCRRIRFDALESGTAKPLVKAFSGGWFE